MTEGGREEKGGGRRERGKGGERETELLFKMRMDKIIFAMHVLSTH